MKTNKGISLIVLVITIIIMIVLAGAIILSLNNVGIIERANEAVNITNINQVQTLAELKWSEAYLRGEQKLWQLKKAVRDGLAQEGINIDDYDVEITTNGTTVSVKEDTSIPENATEKTGADGLFKYVKLANGEIQITRYIGPQNEGQKVTIPATYVGEDNIEYKVYSIGNMYADSHDAARAYNIFGEENLTTNTTITSLIIEDGIKEIKAVAFSGCSGLSGQLILPSTLKSIGGGAFNGCTGLTGDLIIPEGVTTIAAVCFNACTGFNGKLQLPDTLETIGTAAFYKCANITGNLIIPEGITTVETLCFVECKGFDGILKLPSTLTTIGSKAFYKCSGLTGTITTSGITVGENAFGGCTNLTVN